MARLCTATFLTLALTLPAAAQVAPKDSATVLRFSGKLGANDPLDTQRQTPCRVHRVKMKDGKTYTIDMVSTELDSYLRLEDAGGNQLDEDDDSGGNLNARMIFHCTKAGEYKVICTMLNAQMAGAYTLTVKESAQTVKLGTPHQGLLGKAAPDFQAGFAVNGKATRLSDLRGKVVLLTFWDVQSSTSAAILPRLREWDKKFRGDGLAIVGLTFYNFEIGQKVGFDRQSGRFTRLSDSDKNTEQAMLQAFADYHHLDYLLLAQPRAEAVATFDRYIVNGLPQFVLIDRQGTVRSVRVGENAQTMGALEDEFKKLLKEK